MREGATTPALNSDPVAEENVIVINDDARHNIDEKSSLFSVNTRDQKRAVEVEGVDNCDSKKARVYIESDSLVTIFHTYNVQFSKYCKGRKKVVQKVPANVWRSVYKGYVNDMRLKSCALGESFNESKLQCERTRQETLRPALNDNGTGVSDVAAEKEGNDTL